MGEVIKRERMRIALEALLPDVRMLEERLTAPAAVLRGWHRGDDKVQEPSMGQLEAVVQVLDVVGRRCLREAEALLLALGPKTRAQRFRAVFLEAGLSQAEVARILGVTAPAVYHWLRAAGAADHGRRAGNDPSEAAVSAMAKLARGEPVEPLDKERRRKVGAVYRGRRARKAS